jgi:hypothetical protein
MSMYDISVRDEKVLRAELGSLCNVRLFKDDISGSDVHYLFPFSSSLVVNSHQTYESGSLTLKDFIENLELAYNDKPLHPYYEDFLISLEGGNDRVVNLDVEGTYIRIMCEAETVDIYYYEMGKNKCRLRIDTSNLDSSTVFFDSGYVSMVSNVESNSLSDRIDLQGGIVGLFKSVPKYELWFGHNNDTCSVTVEDGKIIEFYYSSNSTNRGGLFLQNMSRANYLEKLGLL